MVKSVLIIGAGPGLSASLARLCSKQGMKVALAARNIAKLEELSKETNASLYSCDASSISDVQKLFHDTDHSIGTPDLVVYNPSARVRGPIEQLDAKATKKALEITSF